MEKAVGKGGGEKTGVGWGGRGGGVRVDHQK